MVVAEGSSSTKTVVEVVFYSSAWLITGVLLNCITFFMFKGAVQQFVLFEVGLFISRVEPVWFIYH